MAGRRVKAVERVESPVLTSFYGKLVGVGVLVFAVAMFIGTRDDGQININSVITASNAAQNGGDVPDGPDQNVATVPEALRNLPNGGLIPADPSAVPPPAPEPEPTPEETASTTPAEGESGEEGEATEGENATEPADVLGETPVEG